MGPLFTAAPGGVCLKSIDHLLNAAIAFCSITVSVTLTAMVPLMPLNKLWVCTV